jgi:uracil-DNA glycosylase family 4
MDRDPREELRQIVGHVRAHLALQEELGLEHVDLRWPEPAAPPQHARPTLEQVRADLGECTRCKLHTHRTQIVFGVGNPNAKLVFVGEAPGADEDAQGEPFVGRAGQLLTKIIQAMGMTREDVYICNIIKCRPPNNRTPESDEVVACQPFLLQQLQAIAPRFICALGGPAAQTLLQTKEPISRLRGRFHDFHGIPLLPTFHPAFLLRNPNEKKTVWEDMKLLLRHIQQA